MSSPRMDRYTAFTDGIANNNAAAMEACVSRRFRAELGKGLLTFAQFVAELDRQRTAFPDLGESVRVVKVTHGATYIRVAYNMIVTFAGPLRGNRGNSLPPNGNTVVIVASDYVEFDSEDKIVKFTVSSNMGMTVEQLTR